MGWALKLSVILLECMYHALAYPIPQDGSGREEGDWSSREYLMTTLGVAALLSSVTTLLACVCCKRSGFKELGSVSSRVAGSSSSTINHGGPREEFTMFPPPGISQLSVSSTHINFEPLPDIRPRSGSRREQQITDKTLPASFPSQVSSGLPTDEWFAEPHQNFPRNQLQYVKEIGKGWFGHVLEGRATGIFSDHTKGDSPVTSSLTPNAASSRGQTPVAVKVLREDATPTEQMYFLHELRPYRDLSHPNVLKVLAQCLETEPFLILLQLCPKGDLKAVVRNDKKLSDATLLRMTLDVAAGLMHMHSHSFIHTDLAARNCVVDEDYTVKIGDYGYNIDFYKTEYYCAGEVALPLRWCSPETLKCTDTTIETKEVTKAANVWSFGIIMWEIASRGEMPYTNLDDDRVIQEVIVDQSCILEPPKSLELHAQKLYNIMKLCWSAEPSRPPIDYLTSLLTHLWENHSVVSLGTNSMNDFELRWNQLQQHQSQDHSIIHGANTSDLRFESDFSLSIPSGSHMGGALSPSLQNLHGSVEDLDAKMAAKFGSAMPSWLGMEPGQPMDSLTREITDAILKLDDYLAGEKSEPSTTQASPEKDGVNFKLGKDSFVSHPPESKLVHTGGLPISGSGHPSLTRMLSEGEDEGFTLRLEQGEFTEMVRIKSQSVQDFMKLTVVDDGSDSDNASQRNSLAFEPVNKPLASDKSFSSEGNIREALRDVKFMGEIERLQAEHKYSIITEASRENPSSIEYRLQDFNFDKPLSGSEMLDESETGSTDKLAGSVDSDNSNNFTEKQNSEQDPFLGEVISSEYTEERTSKTFPIPEKNNDSVNSSLVHQTLSASPDFVVSSREAKPATLPDIVVHDSAVKLSTPSPPPVDSPVKVINVNQPKEFRLVFSENEDTSSNNNKFVYEKESESRSQGDSVIFSENIKDNILCKSSGKTIYDQRTEVCVKDSDVIDGSVSVGVTEESSCKEEDISKFLDFAHENHEHQLTSTPLKVKEGCDEIPTQIMRGNDDGEITEESLSCSEKSSIHDTSYEDVGEFTSGVVEADPDNSGAKHRLVFGYHDDQSQEDSESTESDEEEENSVLERDTLEETPSYKPEPVVEGEEVVIGASDDYSLDLYKAVKSSPASVPDIKKANTNKSDKFQKSKDPSENELTNHVGDVEYDLEQWDKFLGSKLNVDTVDTDVVFRESPSDGLVIKGDNSGDILGFTFGVDNTGTEVDDPDGRLKSNRSEKSLVDLSSTFEHSTCDEIQEILLNDEGKESVTDVSRPIVNTDLFFNSDSSLSTSGSAEISKELPVIEEPCNLANSSGIHASFDDTSCAQSSGAGESYLTANSALTSVELPSSTEVSELYKTPISEKSHLVISSNTDSEISEDTEVLEKSSFIDISSDSFTYKKEVSVDNSCDMVEGDSINYPDLPLVKELNPQENGHAEEVSVHSTVLSSDSLNSKHSEINLKEVDAQTTTEALPRTDEVVKGAALLPTSGAPSLDESKHTETDKASNKLNLENSKAVTANSAQLMLGELDPESRTNLIIKDEDDLSPSAYQGKLKSDDCWSSQESQDSAVENDEAENGEFWQQQMMAWQEAAFQTRQLLQQAAGNGNDAAVACLKGSQEDLEASPRSDTSSTKSPYSSSDMLNLDDEGTYVSYNTTDDEEVLGYKPEDINALRAELNLKLGGLQDERDPVEPDDPDDPSLADRESVVINYRGIVTTTLSPIKEESFLDEDESPVKKIISKNDSFSSSSFMESIDFEESLGDVPVNGAENADGTFVINEAVNDAIVNNKMLGLSEYAFAEDGESISGVNDGTTDSMYSSGFLIGKETTTTSDITLDSRQENLSLENTHNSLILEDLDDENGLSSIQVYNSRDNLDADDVLVVDTVTNEATIVEGGIPRSHLAFITDEEQHEPTDVQPFNYDESDDVAPESIPSAGSSRFDEVRHREQFIANNPSWENRQSSDAQEYDGDSESKPVDEFVNGIVSSEENLDRRKDNETDIALQSPQGIQVPHYHSYFTSALSTISHPSASLEEPPMFEQVEHISLPYDVNYPAAGEQLQSLEDVSEGDEVSKVNEASTEEIVNEDIASDAPIKLNFLGRLYSDDSEEKADEKHSKSHSLGEATLLSDSDEETDTQRLVDRPKTPEPSDLNQMTSAEFLASERYQINETDEIEEQIEVETGYEEDSDDDEDGIAVTPGKLGQVEFRMIQDPRYTPDWESDSDSDGESSSTSGEFMWRQEDEGREGNKEDKEVREEKSWAQPVEDCHPGSFILDVIEEEAEEEEAREGDVDDDGCSDDSESGEEEFTPSKWNRDLTPSHSLLKSPQNKSSLKKSVRWKRQRHHRVYEYPPEPRSWEPTPTESHQRRSWSRSSLDYLSLADWELGADEFIADDSGDMDDYVYRKPSRPAPPPPIYTLGSLSFDDATEGYMVENGEFFIRSSGSTPFTFTSSSFSASDFFPGSTLYFSGQDQSAVSSDSAAVDGELTNDMTEHQLIQNELQSEDPETNHSQISKFMIADDGEQSSPTNTGLGQLRHTRGKLRLEIPTISVASDITKGAAAFTISNEQSEYEKYNGQDISSVNLKRTEPEVSEV